MGDYHRSRWEHSKIVFSNGKVMAADLGMNDMYYQWRSTSSQEGYHCLSKHPVGTFDFFNRVKNFLKIVKQEKIDVAVLSGYGKPEYLAFIILLKLLRKRVILFAESWYQGNIIVDTLKSWFFGLFVDGLFVSGSRARQHFTERLHFKGKIVEGYSVVDNDHFYCSSSKNTTHESNDLQPYILCVARYSEEKNLVLLINAFVKSELYAKFKLVIIGDGPQKGYLEDLVAPFREIFLTGWKGYADLPWWYCNADLFVLPSNFEPWGLVVNEAMCAGLPVYASTRCGCVDDLLANGFGCTFDPDDTEQLIHLFNKYDKQGGDAQERQKQLAIQIIKGYTPKIWAENLNSLVYA